MHTRFAAVMHILCLCDLHIMNEERKRREKKIIGRKIVLEY